MTKFRIRCALTLLSLPLVAIGLFASAAAGPPWLCPAFSFVPE